MKKNNKGFTLAELLIVVAIIAVLVAIAIPVFTNQLEKSREATDIANVRSAYAQLVTTYLADGTQSTYNVAARQTVSGWQGPSGTVVMQTKSGESTYSYAAVTSGNNYTISTSVDSNGDLTINVGGGTAGTGTGTGTGGEGGGN